MAHHMRRLNSRDLFDACFSFLEKFLEAAEWMRRLLP
jgi:hypothetical protein